MLCQSQRVDFSCLSWKQCRETPRSIPLGRVADVSQCACLCKGRVGADANAAKRPCKSKSSNIDQERTSGVSLDEHSSFLTSSTSFGEHKLRQAHMFSNGARAARRTSRTRGLIGRERSEWGKEVDRQRGTGTYLKDGPVHGHADSVII